MRALLADALNPAARDALVAAGWEVFDEPKLSGDTLTERLSVLNPDALVVRSTKVIAAHVHAAPGLGLVVRAGAGVNTIDLATCSDRGVYVANCPGKNAIAVAELVFGLMVALDRKIVAAASDVRAGQWRKSHHAEGARGLFGRTLAIVGMGQIGEAVAWRARGFGMEVRAYSRSLDPKRARLLRVTHCTSPEEAAQGADVLSVHLACTDDTRGCINATVFDALPDGAMFINAARHEVVDEDALLDAVQNRGLRAGLDVLSVEPKGSTDVAHPLLFEDGVVVTPHLGASTLQAAEAVAVSVADVLGEWAQTGRVSTAVNIAGQEGRDGVLVVRHLDRVGVLAGVLVELRGGDVNVGEMENITLSGRKAAIARIAVSGAVPKALLKRVESVEHVLSASYVSSKGTGLIVG
ncbi:MAG: D-3-phosphoglycerate dehydrogenase [Myxococcota bacterium]|jgi:D-3-phosphoglycerate dehydrogenase